ncbi:hypothetical protein LOD99_1444 [Oopsacas minuta]|uniref:Uncharacterized protein n=1 Tax=Oopsacas minuta TaxID=111878 RepID=A0AAV7K6S3_9METZ|nr:hypothetical protein LOD99_1444 [Oopsacas minuta]
MGIPTGWCTSPYSESITRLVVNEFTRLFIRIDCPPVSSDLNPCDYYLWGRLEELVNNRAYDNISALKRALSKVWSELDKDEVAWACNLFPDRVRSCLKARGNRFEMN